MCGHLLPLPCVPLQVHARTVQAVADSPPPFLRDALLLRFSAKQLLNEQLAAQVRSVSAQISSALHLSGCPSSSSAYELLLTSVFNPSAVCPACVHKQQPATVTL